MYKLYLDKGTRQMIDVSEEEQDIIDTMGEYIKDDIESRFMIIESTKEYDWVYAIVNGYEQYVNYIQNYNERLKEMSCTDLKRNILSRVNKK